MTASLDVRVGFETPNFSLDVEFRAPPGVTVLFGPSGAGKSRTLGCIAGLTRPSRGRIALGADVWFDAASRTQQPIERRRVAYVFQSLALFPHMTAAQNVAYGMAIPWSLPLTHATRSRSRQDRERRRTLALDMLARMRVGHLADRRPATFSGGEAQRVALARAFAMSPRVLLLDEPFSALDVQVKDELLAEVGPWIEQANIPAIVVTHLEEEAVALGKHVVFLERGRVSGRGPIEGSTLSLPNRNVATK